MSHKSVRHRRGWLKFLPVFASVSAAESRTKPSRVIGLLFLGAIASALVACGHVPVSGLYQLSKIDMKTTDLQVLRIAVQVPSALRPGVQGVTMVLKLAKTPRQPEVVETFVLKPILGASVSEDLARYRKSDRTFYIYRIPSHDLPRFERIRALQAGVSGGGKRRGGLSISTSLCRTSQADPTSARVSTFLKTSETGRYIPFMLEADLLAEAGAQRLEDIAQRCEAVD